MFPPPLPASFQANSTKHPHDQQPYGLVSVATAGGRSSTSNTYNKKQSGGAEGGGRGSGPFGLQSNASELDPANQNQNGQSTLGPIWTEPILFDRGMFVGRCMRFLLEVAQEPINGKRKTEKDRRPLAHCPIVRLRIRECTRSESGIADGDSKGRPAWSSEEYEAGEGWSQDELDLGTIEPGHFVCSADLNAPSEEKPIGVRLPSGDTVSSTDSTSPSTSATSSRDAPSFHKFPTLSVLDEARRTGHGVPPGPPISDSRSFPDGVAGPGPSSLRHLLQGSSSRRIGPGIDISPQRTASYAGEPASSDRPHVGTMHRRGRDVDEDDTGEEVHAVGRTGIREPKRARPTGTTARNLCGSAHISGTRVPAPEGGLGLWFLFTDLSVRQEGSYTLRFRCFDISAVSHEDSRPVPALSKAYSRSFKVYSPRTFPGLPKPTELAEHFNRLGFKLNARKNDRRADSEDDPPTDVNTKTTVRPRPSPLQHLQPEPPRTSSLSAASAVSESASFTAQGVSYRRYSFDRMPAMPSQLTTTTNMSTNSAMDVDVPVTPYDPNPRLGWDIPVRRVSVSERSLRTQEERMSIPSSTQSQSQSQITTFSQGTSPGQGHKW